MSDSPLIIPSGILDLLYCSKEQKRCMLHRPCHNNHMVGVTVKILHDQIDRRHSHCLHIHCNTDVSYSFGIIIHEVISGLPPYYDLSHDNSLAIKIYQELRPRFNIRVPQPIIIIKDA
ncbi:uncharacterized protein OCT59_017665 [Rhizophagus irregularis]|uniref:Protein kinase domain-containing protein n=1 Tax=Rhizophagus irregularis (strain DAOM 181602 / DAOM 197198 / MUCL 43194) TaxID=747089 RepID=A0A2P4QJW3_RHIID|nr:hypothetical protein GLOIN_2v1767242 [Rhizophagus irregularis DAOM 181602=DAOM 197198]POG77921.1 hypothetical protein GLOIN_2v1767242 [Rhizophagus irregularis DAOM 181602=DAOM 197198]UZO25399.1 hypothetical protein OCT59_017665 [Rhizophagus irregularis]GET66100.1 kinase-like domain-containing protein [Rhizophagus irregularis DAOM 181602=DAOM 197198]|eukprot:XP_025184787.1 hypothetical protein GLOIN_2v1767242 [Rhizophagus irregularis DAOM 181602=DAOM 197198]